MLQVENTPSPCDGRVWHGSPIVSTLWPPRVTPRLTYVKDLEGSSARDASSRTPTRARPQRPRVRRRAGLVVEHCFRVRLHDLLAGGVEVDHFVDAVVDGSYAWTPRSTLFQWPRRPITC